MRLLKIIILIAFASLLGACTHTDENGATISRSHLFGKADCSIGNNA